MNFFNTIYIKLGQSDFFHSFYSSSILPVNMHLHAEGRISFLICTKLAVLDLDCVVLGRSIIWMEAESYFLYKFLNFDLFILKLDVGFPLHFSHGCAFGYRICTVLDLNSYLHGYSILFLVLDIFIILGNWLQLFHHVLEECISRQLNFNALITI